MKNREFIITVLLICAFGFFVTFHVRRFVSGGEETGQPGEYIQPRNTPLKSLRYRKKGLRQKQILQKTACRRQEGLQTRQTARILLPLHLTLTE